MAQQTRAVCSSFTDQWCTFITNHTEKEVPLFHAKIQDLREELKENVGINPWFSDLLIFWSTGCSQAADKFGCVINCTFGTFLLFSVMEKTYECRSQSIVSYGSVHGKSSSANGGVRYDISLKSGFGKYLLVNLATFPNISSYNSITGAHWGRAYRGHSSHLVLLFSNYLQCVHPCKNVFAAGSDCQAGGLCTTLNSV